MRKLFTTLHGNAKVVDWQCDTRVGCILAEQGLHASKGPCSNHPASTDLKFLGSVGVKALLFQGRTCAACHRVDTR